MKFYTVDEQYIAALKAAQPRKVLDNYQGTRPYIGVLLEVNGTKLLAPLTSHKPKHDTIDGSKPTVFKLHEVGNSENKLGMIQINNMIPVYDDVIELLDLGALPRGYRNLLDLQRQFIRKHESEVSDRAARLYKLVTEDADKDSFFSRLSCDFLLLEHVMEEFRNA